jgi:hypothetical protein
MDVHVDISHMLWAFVDVVRSMAYDDIAGTAEFKWLERSVGSRYAIAEDAFVPWVTALHALDACGMCIPPGVTFADGRYLLDDVNALFLGMCGIAVAVKESCMCSNFSQRMDEFCICVDRMKNVVDVHDLASELEHKLK